MCRMDYATTRAHNSRAIRAIPREAFTRLNEMSNRDHIEKRSDGFYAIVNNAEWGPFSNASVAGYAMRNARRRADNERIAVLASEGKLQEALQIADHGYAQEEWAR